jgi:hypothetical protein
MDAQHKCSPACTAGWSGTRKCHCKSCGANFSSITNFDKHRPSGACLSPTSVGLVLNDRAIYIKPGEVDLAERLQAGKK